ncbi:MAG: phosphotransferase family protein [Actinobacteria bacterium]|nr:phosphotransferase family protein [Actinomycetota bacterium]
MAKNTPSGTNQTSEKPDGASECGFVTESQPQPNTTPPQTSTRDLTELHDLLVAWLATQLSAGAEPTISDLTTPGSNGMSSETVLFDASWTSDDGVRTEALVARLAPDPANLPVFPTYELDKQFRAMQIVGDLGAAPVPPVFWSEPSPEPLGTPFIVMGRVDGVVPPDVMPYNFGDNWLFDASPEDQRRLEDTSVATLAALHGISDPENTFSFLASSRPEATALQRHVGATWDYYQWVADGQPSPLIERCFDWLRAHWPGDEGPTVLSWGDARIGNMMFSNFEPVAVLDWEMVAFGPREIDLAWFIFLHRFFEDITTQYGMPGMPSFLERDRVAATYEKLTGYAPRDLDFFTMYAALRHGIVMSRVQRRAIRFGEAVMPDDIDDLIMHRATLEAMVAGSYWT